MFPLSQEPQSDGLTYRSDRTVVATGSTAAAGKWRMSVAESDRGFCFGIELLDQTPPGARGPDVAEGCGGASPSFDAASVGGGTALPDTTLVYGPVPEAATAVRVNAPGQLAGRRRPGTRPRNIRAEHGRLQLQARHGRAALTNQHDGNSAGGAVRNLPVPGVS